MKTKLVIVFVLSFVLFLPVVATEPDTVWTKEGGGKIHFLPNGNEIFDYNSSYKRIRSVEDGHVISGREIDFGFIDFFPEGITYVTNADDQIYIRNIYTDSTIKMFDSVFKDELDVFFERDNIARDVNVINSGLCLSDDGRYLYLLYTQKDIEWPATYIPRACIYKIDLETDSIVLKKGGFQLTGPIINVKNSDYFLITHTNNSNWDFYSKDSIAYVRKFRETPNTPKISKTGRYLTTGTVYDMQVDSIIFKPDYFKTKASTESVMSKDEQYMVISEVNYDSTCRVRIWKVSDESLVYSYEYLNYYPPWVGDDAWYIDVSPDNTKILVSGTYGLYMLRARWNGNGTEIEHHPETIIKPNPADKKVTIEFDNKIENDLKINIFDNNGKIIKEMSEQASRYSINSIEIPVSDLQNGIFHIVLSGKNINKSYKLIIER